MHTTYITSKVSPTVYYFYWTSVKRVFLLDFMLLSSVFFQSTQFCTRTKCICWACYWQQPTAAVWQYLPFLWT